MANMFSGILSLVRDAIRISENHDPFTLTIPERRAVIALMRYPIGSEGWVPPKHLTEKEVCGPNKTTTIWKQLHARHFIEVKQEEIKNKGHTTSPTRIRLIRGQNAPEVISQIIFLFFRHQQLWELMNEFRGDSAPLYYVENREAFDNAIRELKKEIAEENLERRRSKSGNGISKAQKRVRALNKIEKKKARRK